MRDLNLDFWLESRLIGQFGPFSGNCGFTTRLRGYIKNVNVIWKTF